MAVMVRPGQIAFTRMPRSAYSSATALVMPRMACLLAV